MIDEESRKYTSEKRALTAERTRLRVINAARGLLSESGYPRVSVDEIAERAKVSRQTVYSQFGSKQGVLQAVAEHVERLAFGRVDIVEGARQIKDPISTLRNGIVNVMDFHRDNASLLRNVEAQALYDPDFRSVWAARKSNRWAAIRILVGMLEDRGQLSVGWTADEAADWLWSDLSFEKYHQLVIERGWTPEQMSERILRMVNVMLLSDSADKSPGDSTD